MKEQLVSFETAKLANKKGFYEWTLDRYNRKGNIQKPENQGWSISAPTQSLLQKWLREKYNLLLVVDLTQDCSSWKVFIRNFKDGLDRDAHSKLLIPFDSYEEALEEALKTILKLI